MKNMVMENAYLTVYALKSGTYACLEECSCHTAGPTPHWPITMSVRGPWTSRGLYLFPPACLSLVQLFGLFHLDYWNVFLKSLFTPESEWALQNKN